MSQWKTVEGVPTAAVTNSSNIVTVAAGGVTANVDVGDWFGAIVSPAHSVLYQVSAKNSDTEFELSANWAGVTDGAAIFHVTRDFSSNFAAPLLSPGDIATSLIYSRAIQILDAAIATGGTTPAGGTTFLTANQDNSVDVGALATVVLSTGSGWTSGHTHTLTGTVQTNQRLILENNSGQVQVFQGTPLDLSPITLQNNEVALLEANNATGKLRPIVRNLSRTGLGSGSGSATGPALGYLLPDQDQAFDASNSNNYHWWKTGTGWTTQRTITFNGVPPVTEGEIVFSNESGQTVLLANGTNSPLDLPAGFDPFPLKNGSVVWFHVNASTFKLIKTARAWEESSDRVVPAGGLVNQFLAKLSGTDFHFGWGFVDHGILTGLSDDDHPQYIKADGSRAFTNPVAGVLPTAANHFATKEYVETVVEGLIWQQPVLDKDLTVPPGTPNAGDRYIVAAGATGDWAGQDDNITQWNGVTWDFFTPSEGWTTWVQDEDVKYQYDGIDWFAIGAGGTSDHGALLGLGDDDHPQYHNDARADTWLATKSVNDLSDAGALAALNTVDTPQIVDFAVEKNKYKHQRITYSAADALDVNLATNDFDTIRILLKTGNYDVNVPAGAPRYWNRVIDNNTAQTASVKTELDATIGTIPPFSRARIERFNTGDTNWIVHIPVRLETGLGALAALDTEPRPEKSITNADSPYTPVAADNGSIIYIDTSLGAVVVEVDGAPANMDILFQASNTANLASIRSTSGILRSNNGRAGWNGSINEVYLGTSQSDQFRATARLITGTGLHKVISLNIRATAGEDIGLRALAARDYPLLERHTKFPLNSAPQSYTLQRADSGQYFEFFNTGNAGTIVIPQGMTHPGHGSGTQEAAHHWWFGFDLNTTAADVNLDIATGVNVMVAAGTEISGPDTSYKLDPGYRYLILHRYTDRFDLIKFPLGDTAGDDTAPTVVTSTASPHALADAQRMHRNVQVRSHFAGVDFEVPQAATAGSAWWVFFDHDSCIISINGGVGSINGGALVEGINGGWAVVSVKSNAGSAPVVEVKGNIIVPTNSVSSTKTLDIADHSQDFTLVAGAGTQTLTPTAGYSDGWYVNYANISGGVITIDAVTNGGDNNHSLSNNGVVTIKKWGGRLLAFGSDGVTVLDAA